MTRELPPPVPGNSPRRRVVRQPVDAEPDPAEDFEADGDEPQPASTPMWGWAIGLAVAVGVARQAFSGSSQSMSFQFGAAIGWTIVPLVVAWFVSQFWKARHAPLVAVGVISVTSLSALVTNNKAGDEVRTVYMAELGHELDGWRNDVRAWLGQGVGNWQRLKGRAAIERHVRSGGGLRDAAMLLQKELIGGTRFKERLADRVRSERRVDEAWAVVRELPDILQSRKELALVRQLIDAQLRLCAEVHQLDGHFLLLGSGELVPNADVDQGARDRIRELQPQVLQLLAKVREIPSLR